MAPRCAGDGSLDDVDDNCLLGRLLHDCHVVDIFVAGADNVDEDELERLRSAVAQAGGNPPRALAEAGAAVTLNSVSMLGELRRNAAQQQARKIATRREDAAARRAERPSWSVMRTG